jgi:hypothetical protein
MATTTSMATLFKVDLMKAVHNFLLSGGDTFKIALYTSTATLDATTTVYSATNEVSGTGYTAAGNTLTRVDPTSSGTTAFTDFADSAWTTSTITARSCGIHNTTDTKWCSAHDFGADKTSTAGTFTIVFPTPDATNAILRIA